MSNSESSVKRGDNDKVQIEADQLFSSLRHDLNCLKDPNRQLRKRSLESINEKLNKYLNVDSVVLLEKVYNSFILQALINLGLQPTETESIREAALQLNKKIFSIIADSNSSDKSLNINYLDLFLPLFIYRLTQSPGAGAGAGAGAGPSGHNSNNANNSNNSLEPAEHLRLSLIQLLHQIINYQPNNILNNLNTLITIACRCIMDSFGEIKKETSLLIQTIAHHIQPSTVFPSVRYREFGRIAPLLIGSLKLSVSSNALVRVSILKALSSTASACNVYPEENDKDFLNGVNLHDDNSRNGLGCVFVSSEWGREILPSMVNLLQDRSPKIRDELTKIIANWANMQPMVRGIRSQLLIILMSMLSDEIDSVSLKAQDELHLLSQALCSNPNEMILDSNISSPNPKQKTSIIPLLSDVELPLWYHPTVSSPIKIRPPLAARSLISFHLVDMVPVVLASLSEWTAVQRMYAASLLHCLVIYGEANIQPYVANILLSAYRCVRHEDIPFADQVQRAVRAMGLFIPPREWLPHISQQLSGFIPTKHGMVVNNNTNQKSDSIGIDNLYRASVLATLAQLVAGTAGPFIHLPSVSSFLMEDIVQILQLLSLNEQSGSDDSIVRFWVCVIVTSLLDYLLKQHQLDKDSNSHLLLSVDARTSSMIFSILLQLDARTPPTSDGRPSMEQESILQAMAKLGQLELLQEKGTNNKYGDLQGYADTVYGRHFSEQLVALLGSEGIASPDSILWDLNNASHAAFFKLLSVGRGARYILPHFHVILPILCACSDPNKIDWRIRSSTLATILQLLLVIQESHDGCHFNAAGTTLGDVNIITIINRIISPNLTWRAGEIAEKIRVQAMAALHALYFLNSPSNGNHPPITTSTGLVSTDVVEATENDQYTLLLGNMDDVTHDPLEVRLKALAILSKIFKLKSTSIQDVHSTMLWHAILARFDDNANSVRIQAFETMGNFISKSKNILSSESYGHIISSSLLHLDDVRSPEVQTAAFQFLKEIANFNLSIFTQTLQKWMGKNQNSFCNLLIEHANKLATSLS